MSRISYDIPDAIHDDLREESVRKNIPMKIILVETLRERYADESTTSEVSQ
ncbi:hypothetical protein GJR96_08445 [Haloferax sp. MBLA0076]|uniref:CopG family transcriptional regulator n=1 Tax=Haloferax litoreum TaxID=2666140 RepID=A0A6A8GF12_9EURY|nr:MULTISPECIES: hypothetical protein [Haloferax]MRX21984.1 hypothetical protein [Haloferax litoreum]